MSSLAVWTKRPTFPDFFQHIFKITIEENAKFTEFMDDHTVDKLQEVYDKWIENELIEVSRQEQFLLRGFRCTVGSVLEEVPSNDILIQAFEKQWHERDPLSIGARALSKHVHRSRNGWYGLHEKDFRGPAVEKNKLARWILDKIMTNGIWFNVHSLPHSVIVYEIRVREGYGCRWSINGDFRGFLEPMMKDGHESRWRHD